MVDHVAERTGRFRRDGRRRSALPPVPSARHVGHRDDDRRRSSRPSRATTAAASTACGCRARKSAAAIASLRAMTYEERVANGCIGADRADLVLAGCAILEAIRRAVSGRSRAHRRPRPARGHSDAIDGRRPAVAERCGAMSARRSGRRRPRRRPLAQGAGEDRASGAKPLLETMAASGSSTIPTSRGPSARAIARARPIKLIEMDERYKLLKPGQRIVDLGAAPGGWAQVAAAKSRRGGGPRQGRRHRPPRHRSDPWRRVRSHGFSRARTRRPRLEANARRTADVVLSDMAANATGHKKTDQLRIIGLAEAAAEFAREVLARRRFVSRQGVAGRHREALLARLKRDFAIVRHVKPQASRADSAELYVLATGFRGAGNVSFPAALIRRPREALLGAARRSSSDPASRGRRRKDGTELREARPIARKASGNSAAKDAASG